MKFRPAKPSAWKDTEPQPVPGTKGYYATKDGRIFKKRARGEFSQVSAYPHKSGYLTTTVTYENGTRKTKGVHQLVAWTFIGPQKLGNVVDHINHNRHDNRVENLRYLTKSENRICANGVNLDLKQVRKIRKMLADGKGLKEVSEKFQVPVGTLRFICGKVTLFGTDFEDLNLW